MIKKLRVNFSTCGPLYLCMALCATPRPSAAETTAQPDGNAKQARATAGDLDSPQGLWTTIDDDGKTAKSVVRIEIRGGKLYATIVRILNPAKQDAVCSACTDDRKQKRLLGLEIVRDLQKSGDRWEGGHILDPANGKEYSTDAIKMPEKLKAKC